MTLKKGEGNAFVRKTTPERANVANGMGKEGLGAGNNRTSTTDIHILNEFYITSIFRP